MDEPNLRRLAAGDAVELGSIALLEGSLPPRRVAARALAQLEAGAPAFWCVPFLIVRPSRDAVLGGCGFKSPPVERSAEISYGVAKSERGRGIATAALGELLARAAASGLVDEIVAHIVPANQASSRLVRRLGFEQGAAFVDADGATVVRWHWRVARQGADSRERNV